MTTRGFLAMRWMMVAMLALLMSGCGAIVVGGAVATAKVVHDRRTTGSFVEDQSILLKAIQLRDENQALNEQANVSIDVFNMQVLLTGQAQNMAVVDGFKRQVDNIPSVRGVFNEVVVGAEATFGESTSDAYLTTKVKLALFDVDIDGFDPTRVKVTSAQGSVFLMGLLTPAEADAATEKVRFVGGVKRVVKLFEYITE
ncbi:MAG: BON domain-containing protein [Gammaproteobacteria bacterium]|nr:BON domain-containing protein [Gammaproteobacteria bacterium]